MSRKTSIPTTSDPREFLRQVAEEYPNASEEVLAKKFHDRPGTLTRK
jgi:hypothetical protein